MGYGDNIIATGFARGATKRGKRIAFGDGRKIIWDHHSEQIFKGNPNIAPQGSEKDSDLEWHPFCRGNRQYITHDRGANRWIWNYKFKPIRGEVFLDEAEVHWAEAVGSGFILIEPNVPNKPQAINKQWSHHKFDQVALGLRAKGYEIIQLANPMAGDHAPQLLGAHQVRAPSFRHALALMQRAALFIGAEGGLHHGAAAVGTDAVVLFGGWVPPEVTGYNGHANIARGKACGSLAPCPHCKEIMESISAQEVFDAAKSRLKSHQAIA